VLALDITICTLPVETLIIVFFSTRIDRGKNSSLFYLEDATSAATRITLSSATGQEMFAVSLRLCKTKINVDSVLVLLAEQSLNRGITTVTKRI